MENLRCPHCGFTNFTGDWMYNNGAFDVEEISTVECPKCFEKFSFRPYESLGYSVGKTPDDID